uniref:Uncharacterized protein n=1 Tax=Ralstonia solanacearum TaxID=305 RepID=A0A0S4UPC1_RALSL|nr:conserved protein of unknown function [Ralstonia solanacearum]CUV24002.1 conserved protein of unknown function [Ralstonia solanacearum]CUV27686.1 conserved protein of unknown function [Ralstonia solanacearum]CUV33219.1 conserved protein of unknown function [Ralstonia solanacearum]CUV41489.1 conserved protein of unknown function [Ralstonia solanacearum]
MRNRCSSADSSCPRCSAVKPLAYRYCGEADFLNRRFSRSGESAAMASMAPCTFHAGRPACAPAALTDGVRAVRPVGNSASKPSRDRPEAGAVAGPDRVAVAAVEVAVDAAPVTGWERPRVGDGTRVGMVRSRKCAASVPASFRQAAAPCPNSSPALRNRLQSHLACHREM